MYYFSGQRRWRGRMSILNYKTARLVNYIRIVCSHYNALYFGKYRYKLRIYTMYFFHSLEISDTFLKCNVGDKRHHVTWFDDIRSHFNLIWEIIRGDTSIELVMYLILSFISYYYFILFFLFVAVRVNILPVLWSRSLIHSFLWPIILRI